MAWKRLFGLGGEMRIVIAALVIEILMGLFPPWRVLVPGEGLSISIGYHPIFLPPNPIANIDLVRLFVQWVIVGLIAAIVIIVVRKSTRGRG